MTVARGKRLTEDMADAMHRLNTSVRTDSALWREDIRGSMAHTRGLERAGVLTPEEARTIIQGLDGVSSEIGEGQFVWDEAKEDVHMNVEARLAELVGPVGGKLHTGRSRNDQVATDLRLWARARTDETVGAVDALAEVLLERAEQSLDLLMPAYTHLQRAQPSRLSHHLMAWQEMLYRDRGRLLDARRRLNESPLGAGAVAGTTYPLDRQGVAEELGFEAPMRNSIDATASRDFLMELGAALAILAVHLSRVGEEIVLWSSQEFGFISLSDAFATSSSMMPQKKNPDVAELVRGKCAVVIGCVTTLLVLEKSLCLGYGRDLQEDKRPIFEAFEAVLLSLRALAGALATATFGAERMSAALEKGHLCATDLADYLVRQRVPFREAHHLVGALVREAEGLGCSLSEVPQDRRAALHPALADAAVASALDPRAAVERRRLLGGPARDCVEQAIAEARARWRSASRDGAAFPSDSATSPGIGEG